MRLLIDINVVLDVALQRPGTPASARVLAMCGRQHEGWLAWHSIATLAYLIERQESKIPARDFIQGLMTWADVAKTGKAEVMAALDLPMSDYEDALQVAAAMACGAQFIVTRNERDFKKSPVPGMNPETFLLQHANPSRSVDP